MKTFNLFTNQNWPVWKHCLTPSFRKMANFWHFSRLLSTQNEKLSSLRSQCRMRLCVVNFNHCDLLRLGSSKFVWHEYWRKGPWIIICVWELLWNAVISWCRISILAGKIGLHAWNPELYYLHEKIEPFLKEDYSLEGSSSISAVQQPHREALPLPPSSFRIAVGASKSQPWSSPSSEMMMKMPLGNMAAAALFRQTEKNTKAQTHLERSSCPYYLVKFIAFMHSGWKSLIPPHLQLYNYFKL